MISRRRVAAWKELRKLPREDRHAIEPMVYEIAGILDYAERVLPPSEFRELEASVMRESRGIRERLD